MLHDTYHSFNLRRGFVLYGLIHLAETKGNHVGDGQGVGDNIYVITHDRCTECVGHFDEPQCAAVCPVDNCCIADPVYPETTDVLLEKARKLNPDKSIDAAKVWSGVRN